MKKSINSAVGPKISSIVELSRIVADEEEPKSSGGGGDPSPIEKQAQTMKGSTGDRNLYSEITNNQSGKKDGEKQNDVDTKNLTELQISSVSIEEESLAETKTNKDKKKYNWLAFWERKREIPKKSRFTKKENKIALKNQEDLQVQNKNEESSRTKKTV